MWSIISWQIDGETMETVTDFIFLGSKITADGDSSHEIESCLLLGRKAMTNLAAAAAKLLQSCPTLRLHRWQPTRLLHPWDSPAKNAGVGCHFLLSRDITLLTKVCLAKAMVFPVVMSGCEIWAIKKAEHRRIDAFELWCWRRLLGVPWTARRSNQSVLKEINPEYSLEGLMLKLKLQYFGHLI